MKQRRVFLLLIFLLAGVTACSPGHLGSNELAFIRNGHLWTIDPSGANAFEMVAQDTPVVSYSWSPTHQILVFRTLDSSFAKTSAAKQLAPNAITGQIEDSPSTVNTIGIDGGSPIPIMFSSPGVQYSNPMWNATGTRLIYRQEPSATHIPGNAIWWASQNDQPGGIAAKQLPGSNSLLSLSYTDSMAIGITNKGLFTVSLTGTGLRFLVPGPLPGHPFPATLERVLWQPHHTHPALLYAQSAGVVETNGRPQGIAPTISNGLHARDVYSRGDPLWSPVASPESVHKPPEVVQAIQLMLHAQDGQEKSVVTCTCMQFAWSPDGNSILYSTGTKDTVLNVTTGSSFDIPVEGNSVPFWSPDSKFLLLDGTHTLQLIQLANRQQRTLLSDGVTTDGEVTIAGVHALLQPVPNSLWAPDSSHFLFLTHNRLVWQGRTLSSGKGLYTVTIDAHGQVQGAPVMVDTGDDSQAGWTYQDANTSFLY